MKALTVGPQYHLRDKPGSFHCGIADGRYLLSHNVPRSPPVETGFWNGHKLRVQKGGKKWRLTTKPLPVGKQKQHQAA